MQSHLIEIDYPSLVESIDERFDNITNLMTPNSLVYGSALTSLISGLPSNGDLDISVSSMEYSVMARNLADSTKWIQVEGDTIRESNQRPGSSVKFSNGVTFSTSGTDRKKSKYESGAMPVKSILAFESVTGHKVQIMQSKASTGDPLEDSLDIIRSVDFSFCGMAMDRYGRLLESIPNAFSDCIAQVIRIANYRAETSPNRMKSRLNKYLKRGWQLSIAYDQILRNLKAAKPKPKPKPHKKGISKTPKPCKVIRYDGHNVIGIHPKVMTYLTTSMLKTRITEAFSYLMLDAPTFAKGRNFLIVNSPAFNSTTPHIIDKAVDAINTHLENSYDLNAKLFKKKKSDPRPSSYRYETKPLMHQYAAATSTSTSTSNY